jgi:cytochrome c oxidase subunit 2
MSDRLRQPFDPRWRSLQSEKERVKRSPTTAVLLAALLLAACGTDSSDPTSTTEGATATTVELPGREVYLRNNYCVGCHTILGGAATGPTFLGLAGSEVTLESGEIVTADDDYLRRSIIDPNAQIVDGFKPDVMPDFFGERLTEEDITNVIEYIKSLG